MPTSRHHGPLHGVLGDSGSDQRPARRLLVSPLTSSGLAFQCGLRFARSCAALLEEGGVEEGLWGVAGVEGDGLGG